MGIAFGNELVFLSHQLQFSLLLALFAAYLTHELHKGHSRTATWILMAACGIMIDPTRHILYDAQFNPAQCGPPGKLMSRESFYASGPAARAGQILGSIVLVGVMTRNTLSEVTPHGEDQKCT
eukprot:TRINITY_DN5787_c0_g1_i1.p1 TRINITY_DN5787_c0_g1~~TRINITY_DN5787_c0_g1_i1.p1  ORF type:complete len:123 (+),score=12.16 TRINITY_DN5787_c0_g1_i1:231-599(+)